MLKDDPSVDLKVFILILLALKFSFPGDYSCAEKRRISLVIIKFSLVKKEFFIIYFNKDMSILLLPS